MKYFVFAVLLFAPLAVAGTYLAGDRTSTEVPNIQLRTTVDSVADKPKGARKKHRPRSASGGKSTVRVKGRRPVESRRGTVTVPPAAPPSRRTTDEDDRDSPSGPGAAPVPVAPPATAGPGSEPDDDETEEEGTGEDDPGEEDRDDEGEGGSETGGSEENGDDGDD